jgi:hypothetical protein
MGTRGFIAFVVDGSDKIAYNHWDSYPGGLGLDVLNWLRDALSDRDHLHQLIRALRVVDPKSEPTDEDIKQLRRWADTNVSSQSLDDWYVLLRGTQGNPDAMLTAGVIEDASQFPADSLFAEWGYVVDLDADMFEAYEGFQQAPHSRGRFKDLTPDRGYYPVALKASWSLDALPTNDAFVAALEPEEDDS